MIVNCVCELIIHKYKYTCKYTQLLTDLFFKKNRVVDFTRYPVEPKVIKWLLPFNWWLNWWLWNNRRRFFELNDVFFERVKNLLSLYGG